MAKGTLLIIDDEPHLLKVLQFSLRKLADKILTVENGRDALNVLRDEKIDCVLCDINLPRMTGIDILKEVRARNQEMPFIFFSADGSGEIIEEAARLGALDFLFKPHFAGIEEVLRAGLQSLPYSPRPESEFGKALSRIGREGK